MLRWSVLTALIALSLAGCDVPLDGLGDPPVVDAAGSTDVAEVDTYEPPPETRFDSGSGTKPDASLTSLKDGSSGGNDAHAKEAGAPDSGQGDASDETGDDRGDEGGP